MQNKAKKFKFSFTTVTIILIFGGLAIYSLSLLAMYLWGLFTSLKSNYEFRNNLYWMPEGWIWNWHWANYEWAFDNLVAKVTINGASYKIGLAEMLFNSMVFSTVGALVGLLCTWLVAYLISTFPNYWLSKILVRLNIVLMMVPIVGALPSALQVYRALGLYDNWGYVFVGSIGFVGANLLIFQAYLGTVSNELREAASIDGAGNFVIMTKIFFPLTIKMFLILFLIAFIGRWNDYMTMLIWMPSKPTLAYGIYSLSATTDTTGSWPPTIIAGCMLLMVPILLLFLCFRNKIIGQVTMGALKG